MKNKLNKKDYLVVLAIPLAIAVYMAGAVTFTSYVVMLTLSFLFGCFYTRFKIEWEDYKILKNVQKSLIKLNDYERLKKENEKLKNKIIDLE